MADISSVSWSLLNSIVGQLGGYENVTKQNNWGEVAKRMNYSLSSAQSLKKMWESKMTVTNGDDDEEEEEDEEQQEMTDDEIEGEYEVEDIVGHEKVGKQTFYLVKWKGFSEEHNTLEPESNLVNCIEKLRLYKEKLKKPQAQTKRQKTTSSSSSSSSRTKTTSISPTPLISSSPIPTTTTTTTITTPTSTTPTPTSTRTKSTSPIPLSNSTTKSQNNSNSNVNSNYDSNINNNNNYNTTSKENEEAILDEHANFETDEAESILGAANSQENGICFLVKWKGEEERYSWMSSKECRKFVPLLLLDYYEARISFVSPNSS